MQPRAPTARRWTQGVVVTLGLAAPLGGTGCSPPGASTAPPQGGDNLRITDEGRYSSLRIEGGQVIVQHDGSCAAFIDVSCPRGEVTLVEQCEEGETSQCKLVEVEGPRPTCNPPPPKPMRCPKQLRAAAKLAKKQPE